LPRSASTRHAPAETSAETGYRHGSPIPDLPHFEAFSGSGIPANAPFQQTVMVVGACHRMINPSRSAGSSRPSVRVRSRHAEQSR